MFFNIKSAFSIDWIDLINVLKYGLGTVILLFVSVYIASNLLLNSMGFTVRTNLDKFTTAEFEQLTTFWKQTAVYCQNKVVSLGGFLALLVVAEFLIS